MDMILGVSRQHHQGALTVYPAEHLTSAHVHLLCVFLTCHRVAIGTIVHTRYFYSIFGHFCRYYIAYKITKKKWTDLIASPEIFANNS
jgi:hypothetical protein